MFANEPPTIRLSFGTLTGIDLIRGGCWNLKVNKYLVKKSHRKRNKVLLIIAAY